MSGKCMNVGEVSVKCLESVICLESVWNVSEMSGKCLKCLECV